jgi:hypothetical protein
MTTTDPKPDPDPEAYRPISVDWARRIAGQCLKDWVIILAYDGEHDKTHSTTFAHSAGNKALAADLADVCLKAIGVALGPLDGPRMTFEDFRFVPQAVAAAKIAELTTQVETMAATLGEIEAELRELKATKDDPAPSED